MQKWEEKEMERQEAYAEGREEGERVGEARMNKLIVYLLEQVISPYSANKSFKSASLML